MKTTLPFLALVVAVVSAVDVTKDPALDLALKNAATRLDRAALLTDSDWLFDFRAQKSYTYSPGSVVNANAATWPAAVGNGMTIAMLNLGPCAMLPPHWHPRATNMVVSIEGETKTWMIEENGARIVSETLTPGKMTIFPAASVHTMQNTGCGNSTLVSALNSEDAGTTNMATQLFNLPAGMVYAAFGYNSLFANINDIASKIPGIGTGSVLGDAACLKACGITP